MKFITYQTIDSWWSDFFRSFLPSAARKLIKNFPNLFPSSLLISPTLNLSPVDWKFNSPILYIYFLLFSFSFLISFRFISKIILFYIYQILFIILIFIDGVSVNNVILVKYIKIRFDSWRLRLVNMAPHERKMRIGISLYIL